MKKLFLISFLFLFQLSFAQKFYVGVDAAYLMPFVPDVIGVNSENQSIFITPSSGGITYTSSSSYNAVKGSYNSGNSVGGFIGYRLNENISIETGMNYLYSNEYVYSTSSSNTQISSFTAPPQITNSMGVYDYKTKSNMLNIYPALKFSIPNKSFTTYLRTGFIYSITSIINDRNSVSGNQTIEQSRNKYGNSYGLFASLGIEKKLDNHLKIFAEWTLRYQTFSPIKERYTKDIENGVDKLPSMNVSQIEREYVDSYSSTYNGTGPSTDPNQPTKVFASKQTFGSMGLQVGIIYEFGFKKAPVTK